MRQFVGSIPHVKFRRLIPQQLYVRVGLGAVREVRRAGTLGHVRGVQ
jgi:hypothetical protein